jgi:natural product precursor
MKKMKQVKKINLSKLNEAQLNKKQQQLIFGGNSCKCGSCGAYATYENNADANHARNITGTGTSNPWRCICSGGDPLESGAFA